MRIPSQLGRLSSAAATLVILAGCSGGGAQSSGSTFTLPASGLLGDRYPLGAVTKSGVYVSTYNPSQTNLYAIPDSKNVAPTCSIATHYVQGIGVDSAGTLFVPQIGPTAVTTYSKGTCTPAALTLSVPSGSPFDIAFSSAGTVYLVIFRGKFGPPGFISVYPKGASTSTATLSDPAAYYVRGVAVDKAGDVFLAFECSSCGSSSIIEFKKGKMPGTILKLTGLTYVTGLEFDASQNLLAMDTGSGLVEVFAPPYKGAPRSTFPAGGFPLFGKLDRVNRNLYVSDYSNGTVDVYTYPSGTFEYSISNGLIQANYVEGVAVDPSSKN